MKRTIFIFLIIVFVSTSMNGTLWAETDTLTVIHINDTHSHLVPYGPKDAQGTGMRGGIARAATMIGQLMATEKNPLFLHAGDLFVDDLMFNKFFGVPEFQILSNLGCEAMAVGNHEFDLTPDVLKMALSQAGFPAGGFDILSANLDMSQDPTLATMVKPYVIKDVGKLKVGIFGLTTEETNAFSMPSPVVVTSCIEGAVAAVDSLSSKCDMIIALTHLGVSVDSLLAQNVPGIDLIVGGHSHTVIEQPLGVVNPMSDTTWIVQAGCFYDYVGRMNLVYNTASMEILDYELIPIDNTIPEEPQTAAVIQSLVDTLEADPRYGPVYSQIVAEAEIDIEKNYGQQYKDTPMGNLVTDAYRDTTKTDVALAVWGFISQKLYDSPLAGADIFQTVPYGYDQQTGYGFRLMTFNLSGLQLLMGLEYTAEESKNTRDLYVQVSGLSFTYDSSKPFGQKINYVMIGDELINPAEIYSVTTNSGLFNFLGMAGLEPSDPQDAGITEYEAVRDYIIENSPINYEVEGRIEDTKFSGVNETVAHIPEKYELSQNFPNPFNPETIIKFYLPCRTYVTLTVYNMLGQELKTLVDAERNAGQHSITWNASNLANGIYYYQLKTKEATISKRMVLIK